MPAKNYSQSLVQPGKPLIYSCLERGRDQLFRFLEPSQAEIYKAYQKDPAAFGRKFLKRKYTADVRKVMQSVVENRVTMVQSANGTGKSHAAADIAAWAYTCFPNAMVFTLAAPPVDNLKRNIWGKISGIVRDAPELFADSNVSIPGTRIAKKNNDECLIEGLAIPVSGDSATLVSRFSGKHAPYILFIVDEGDGIPEEIYSAIEGCMSGGVARLLILFNPKAENGPVYTKQQNRGGVTLKLTAFNHPNVRTGEDLIPGAVNRDVTVRRINEWTRPLIAGEKINEEVFQVPDFLVGSTTQDDAGNYYKPLQAGYRKITTPDFSFAVLAEYPAVSEGQLISREWVNDAVSRYKLYTAEYGEIPPGGIQPVLGGDIAVKIDSNVAFLRYGSFVAKPDEWKGLDLVDTAKRFTLIYKRANAMYANIDSNGVGASVAPTMQRAGCRAYEIMVTNKIDPDQLTKKELEEGHFALVRDLMMWRLAMWLRNDKGAMIPDDKELIQELIAPTYNKTKAGGKISVESTEDIKKKIGGRSPDKLMALALTFAPIPKNTKGGPVISKRYA